MKQFVKIVTQKNGFTLIELLTALVISSFILVIASTVLISGIQLYKKIGIEVQLRDEADYAVTRIMQELYSNSIDDIKLNCGNVDQCLKLIDDTSVNVSAEIKNDREVSIINKDGINSSSKEIIIEFKNDNNLYIDTEQINSSKISFGGSKITAKCNNKTSIVKSTDGSGTATIQTRCDNAIITIELTVKHSQYDASNPLYDQVLYLTSKFGF